MNAAEGAVRAGSVALLRYRFSLRHDRSSVLPFRRLPPLFLCGLLFLAPCPRAILSTGRSQFQSSP